MSNIVIPDISMDGLRDFCPASFYEPNKPATDEDIVKWGGQPGSKSRGDRPFFESLASRRIATGGNRSAKTTKLVMESGSWCLGLRPWYPKSNQWINLGLPPKNLDKRIRIRFVVSNYKVQIPEVMEELRKWWPRNWWTVKAFDNNKQPAEIEWFDGKASWYFMSHRQMKEDYEGIEADLVVWNEPPPQKLWSALHRGLVSTGGRSITGATALFDMDWFWDTVVEPFENGQDPDYSITYHSIWDNVAENGGYSRQLAKNVRLYLDEIEDPRERMAREHGARIQLKGRILTGFDQRVNLIDPIDLPRDCYILSCIDPAGTRPFAALHVAYVMDRDLGWVGHIFDETYIAQSSRDLGLFCKVFNAKEQGLEEFGPFHPGPSSIILIDPLAEEVQKADKMGRSMRQLLFQDYGIRAQLANRRGKRARLLQLNSRFLKGNYRVWNTCRRLLLEIRNWKWDPDSAKLTSGADDLCDCLSYIDAIDPPSHLLSGEGELPGGIYIPGEVSKSQYAAVREIERKRRWKYAAKYGLKLEDLTF